jgi:4-hydroxybenzoate polyprenyltransferase
MQDREIPICVDLDGTLIRSDLLIESALNLLRRNPLNAFRMVAWLLRGKANLKRKIAQRAEIDVAHLPYEQRLVDWLRSDQAHRRQILCTASDQKLADAVAAHVGGFETVFASDGLRNLAGTHKAQALCDQYGSGGFDYAGNAAPDLQVWKHARHAVVVNASARVVRATQDRFTVERVFEREGGGLRTWIRALRLHQWLKNLLVFLPLAAAHLMLSREAAGRAVLAFLCFGLCASGVYVLNDLLDLDADRAHPRKRWRPFASGALSLHSGLVAAPLLIAAAFVLAAPLSWSFGLVLGAYFVLTMGYSLFLKRVPMLDTVVLAGLYTIRIVAGAAAIRIGLSFWLLAFSMFLFFSLALVKRYTELHSLLRDGKSRVARGYTVEDLGLVQSLGAASGYLSVLVLALYINSTASEALYRHPQILWLLCPALLYWLSRTWLIAHRGTMHDDPVVFALTDNVSRIVLALCAAVVIGAI